MRQICLVGSKIMRPNHDTIYFLHLKLEIKMILLLINLEKVFEKLWKEKWHKKGNIKNVKKYQTNLSQSCDSNHFKHMIIRFSYKLSSSSSAAVIKAKGGQTKYILPLFFNRIATLIKLQNKRTFYTWFQTFGPYCTYIWYNTTENPLILSFFYCTNHITINYTLFFIYCQCKDLLKVYSYGSFYFCI